MPKEQASVATEAKESSVAGETNVVATEPGKRKDTGNENEESLSREVIEGVLLCLALVLLTFWINHTNVGKQFELFSYRVLQGQLKALPPKILVIDIGKIRPDGDAPTSRPMLEMILAAVARYHPAAIGVDIDFSPDVSENGELQYVGTKPDYMAPTDPDFFGFCADFRSKGVPIFLGISRTQLLPPMQWLGEPDYQGLAAALWVPHETRRVAGALTSADAPEWQKGMARTLSSALGTAYLEEAVGETTRFGKIRRSLFASSVKSELRPDLELKESLVDYSLVRENRLHPLRIERDVLPNDLPATLPENFARDQLGKFLASSRLAAVIGTRQDAITNNMVLIGDVTDASDVFENPAEGKPIAGVLIQALAAQTIATRPLYSFPEITRYWLDFFLALSIFGVWLILKRKYHLKVDDGRLLSIMIAIAGFAVIAFALLVNVTHIFWDDFLFVALGLAIHPMSHRAVQRCKHHLRPALTFR